MDRARRDAWAAVFAELDTGKQVWEWPPEEKKHEALLPVGLFEDRDKVTAHEEGDYVVRYWLYGFDVSPIAPRGPIIAKSWHTIGPTFGEHRADEALRNYIRASPDDPDYWEALDLLTGWFLEQHRPLPTRLAEWAILRLKGGLTAPPGHRGDRGRPSYAQANRNLAIADVFDVLGYLGMTGKSLRYSVIAEVLECSEDTVRKALKRHATQAGTVPRPWECWPSPRR